MYGFFYPSKLNSMRIISLEAEHPEIKIGFQIEYLEKDYEILAEILRHCAANCWCKGIPFEGDDFSNLHSEVCKKQNARISEGFYVSIVDFDDKIRMSISKI